jgi:hypothetical protein
MRNIIRMVVVLGIVVLVLSAKCASSYFGYLFGESVYQALAGDKTQSLRNSSPFIDSHYLST